MTTTQDSPSRFRIERRPQEAQFFIEELGNGVELEMVLIPGGTFLMGAPKGEAESRDSEKPQHSVTVPPFGMGRYPVIQAQWRAVAALPQINRVLTPDPSGFKGDNRPVEQVSWLDAVEFCSRLSRHTKRDYRLPTEAQWEYACRAGTPTPFHFGATVTTDLANYDGNYTYGCGIKGVDRNETTPVSSFNAANAFGLSDMHGNVWEWCLDHWHEDYAGAPNDGRAWVDDNKNDNPEARRLLRGGSWFHDPWVCRSACRLSFRADNQTYDIGFRVVCGVSWTA